MVKFKLIKKDGTRLIYWYYPEGKENARPGIIEADLAKDEIVITELAEEDWGRDILPEEYNKLAEEINRMERESGGTDFVEMVTEPIHSTFYGDHAVIEICNHLRNGEIPEKGMQVWY